MRTIFLFLALFLFAQLRAARVDSISIYSPSMQKTYQCVVITPDQKKKQNSLFPSVYLLHGYSGNFSNWINRVPQLKSMADVYQLIIVCPEGAYSSWYFDSPADSNSKFETYISKEVPAYIDAHYPTIKERKSRAITGLSMGGHGGLFLGFRHSDFFGACGSMSGALEISRITRGYGMDKVLGDTLINKQYYQDFSVIREMEKGWKDSIAIIMDCGIEDPIIRMSRSAHEKMMKLKIPHDYIERPGAHNWKYWANAVQYQLLFFRNYFDGKK